MKIPTLLLLTLFCTSSLQAADRPNILLLLIADDMGYSDLGCYGGEVDTPNLDSLAEHGLRFTNYYVNNMCWPTRASLMTSLYPKTALPKNGSVEGGLHRDAATLPESLQATGYRTIMSGKWNLSSWRELDGPGAPPQNCGFGRYHGILSGAASFFAPFSLSRDGKDASADFDFKPNPDYYHTDAISDETIKMLKMLKETDASKPFFAYVSYNAAHWPLHAKPDDIAAYKGHFSKGYYILRKKRHARMKKIGLVNPAWKDIKHREWQEHRMEVYTAQITSMDRAIGRILDHLRDTDQFENTLVLYQHDNGACHVEYAKGRKGNFLPEETRDGRPMKPGNIPGLMPGPEDTYASCGYGWANLGNTPFRLFKQHDHEGGTRSPLIAHWPAGIDHDHTGGLVHHVAHAIGMMPTLLKLVGTEVPAKAPASGNPSLPTKERSFASHLSPEIEDTRAPHEAIYWAHGQGSAIRQGDWKLVRTKGTGWELYNVYEDGTELNDLAKEMPERVTELEALHKAWSKRTGLSPTKPEQKKGKK